jgi:hypothetical protein
MWLERSSLALPSLPPELQQISYMENWRLTDECSQFRKNIHWLELLSEIPDDVSIAVVEGGPFTDNPDGSLAGS